MMRPETIETCISPRRRDRGHGFLHVAGAARRTSGRCPHRSLCSRRGPAEMVTGRRPFAGKQGQRDCGDPDVGSAAHVTLQPVTPPRWSVSSIDVWPKSDERWQTARDLGWELKSIAEERAHAATRGEGRKSGAMLAGALIGAGLSLRSPSEPGSSGRATRRRPRTSDSRARNHFLGPLRA